MSRRWAEESFGLMGRTPDHVAGFLAGYAAKPAFSRKRESSMRRMSRIMNMRGTITCTYPMRSFPRR